MRTAADIRKHIVEEIVSMILSPPMYGTADQLEVLFFRNLNILAFVDERADWDGRCFLEGRGLFDCTGVPGALSRLFSMKPSSDRMAAVYAMVACEEGFLEASTTDPAALEALVAETARGRCPVAFPTDALDTLGDPAFSVGWDTLMFRDANAHEWVSLEFAYTPPRPNHWSRYNAPASSLRLASVWVSNKDSGELAIYENRCSTGQEPPTVPLGVLLAAFREHEWGPSD